MFEVSTSYNLRLMGQRATPWTKLKLTIPSCHAMFGNALVSPRQSEGGVTSFRRMLEWR